jgi:hypothetical protein
LYQYQLGAFHSGIRHYSISSATNAEEIEMPWRKINWLQAAAGAMLGALIAVPITCSINVHREEVRSEQLLRASQTKEREAATAIACALAPEVSGNREVLERLLTFSVDTAALAVRGSAEVEIERQVRMLEGEPFRRTLFSARSHEVMALPPKLQGHVHSLYALMELCEQQVGRVIKEVRADSNPSMRATYLSTLHGACLPLRKPFVVTMKELQGTCGASSK